MIREPLNMVRNHPMMTVMIGFGLPAGSMVGLLGLGAPSWAEEAPFKLSLGAYRFSQGGWGQDANLRHAGEWGNVWAGAFRASRQDVAQTRLGWDRSFGDALRVTVVATGLGRSAKKQQPMTLLKTGTDNMPVQMMGNMTSSVNAGHSSAPDYSNLDTPAVWRSSRESASAHVAALQEKGVDTYDIPAFLRKQAD